MGLEHMPSYLLRKGSGPCAIRWGRRGPGPRTVQPLPFIPPPAPTLRTRLFSLLVFGNLKVRCRRDVGSSLEGSRAEVRSGGSARGELGLTALPAAGPSGLGGPSSFISSARLG